MLAGAAKKRSVVADEQVLAVLHGGYEQACFLHARGQRIAGIAVDGIRAPHPQWAGSRCSGTDCPPASH